jgi:(heptosyl)LPS beta-1,4-glucosyltransferase
MTVTVTTVVFNEERRIERLLTGASLWSDDVLLFDKGSTDKTIEIASGFPNCVVVPIPFSEAGEDDIFPLLHLAKHDWIIGLTPGDQPSPSLVHFLKALNDTSYEQIDTFLVPVRIYTFGEFVERPGPWSLSFQTKLWNRKRVTPQRAVHAPIRLTPSSKTLNYRENLFISHCTHTDFYSFVQKHTHYALSETKLAQDKLKKARESIEKANRHDIDFLSAGPTGLRSLVAWKAYHYLIALACLTDGIVKETTEAHYDQLLKEMMKERKHPV